MRIRKEVFVVIAGTATALLVAFSLKATFGRPSSTEYRYRYSTGGGQTLAQQIKFYEKRLAGDRANALELAVLADLYFDQGRRSGDNSYYERAEATARRSLDDLPSPNLGAKGVLAKTAAARHEFSKALAIGEEMLKENAASEGAMALMATTYLATGELTKAAEYADRLVQIKPVSGNLALRGLVLLGQGREEEGIFDFQHAIRREEEGSASEASWTRAILGRHFFKRGQREVARVLFEEAIRITPEFPLALDLLGQLEAKQRHYQKAESYFNEAFALSRQIPYLLHLADVTQSRGQKGSADALRGQAEELIRKELAGNSYGHRLDLARVLLEKNKPAAAQEAAKLAGEELTVRRNAETYYVQSMALARAGRIAAARDAILAALRVGGQEPEYFYQASVVEAQIGSRERAALYRELAMKTDPFFEAPASPDAASAAQAR